MSDQIKISGIIILIIVLLTSCNYETRIFEEPSVSQTSESFPSVGFGNDNMSTNVEDGIVYVNETLGYQITFPEFWSGWYFVDDAQPSYIEVNFLGKSIAGSTKYEEYIGLGLPMFYIIAEKDLEGETLDSIQYLGDSKGIKYFYATGTGSSLGSLHEVIDNGEGDETELSLTKTDLETMLKMQESMVGVAKTFKAIE